MITTGMPTTRALGTLGVDNIRPLIASGTAPSNSHTLLDALPLMVETRLRTCHRLGKPIPRSVLLLSRSLPHQPNPPGKASSSSTTI